MKTLAFSWHYLWSRPLGAALNVLLLSLGLASITFLLLVGHQLTARSSATWPALTWWWVPRAAPCS
jgi:hypothetical protein